MCYLSKIDLFQLDNLANILGIFPFDRQKIEYRSFTQNWNKNYSGV
jgi:hypothetical protein